MSPWTCSSLSLFRPYGLPNEVLHTRRTDESYLVFPYNNLSLVYIAFFPISLIEFMYLFTINLYLVKLQAILKHLSNEYYDQY